MDRIDQLLTLARSQWRAWTSTGVVGLSVVALAVLTALAPVRTRAEDASLETQFVRAALRTF